jgi:uncharacterized protein involved in exopolysaccharide biosynthesis
MDRLVEPDDRSSTSMRGVVESVFRQRKIFLVATLTVFVLGMAFIFVPHKKYASQMVLLVQTARPTSVISASKTVAEAPASEVSDEQLNSEIEVLTSNDVLNAVIDPQWSSVAEYDRPRDQLDEHSQALGSLQSRMVVTPGRKSHTITVDYTARDPRVATDTMNKVLTAFLNKQRDIGQPSQAPRFFTDEADRYKREWQDAEAELVKYQQAHDVVSVGDKATMMEKQLFDADALLRAADVEVAEVQNRMVAEAMQLKTTPQRLNTLQTAVPLSGTIDQLNLQKVQLELQKTQLLAKYQPTDRLVQQTDQQLQQVEASIAQMGPLSAATNSTNVNPTWQLADQALSTDRSLLKSVQARRDGLLAQVKDLQQKIGSTESLTVEFNALQNKVTELEANYTLFVQKRDEAVVNNSMDANRLLNLAVVESPTYSPDAVRPKPLRDTLIAAFSAVFIGCFCVFAAETMRDTFAAADELEASSGWPVLATVPFEANPSRGLLPQSAQLVRRS